jgi:hypothetical protein
MTGMPLPRCTRDIPTVGWHVLTSGAGPTLRNVTYPNFSMTGAERSAVVACTLEDRWQALFAWQAAELADVQAAVSAVATRVAGVLERLWCFNWAKVG